MKDKYSKFLNCDSDIIYKKYQSIYYITSQNDDIGESDGVQNEWNNSSEKTGIS